MTFPNYRLGDSKRFNRPQTEHATHGHVFLNKVASDYNYISVQTFHEEISSCAGRSESHYKLMKKMCPPVICLKTVPSLFRLSSLAFNYEYFHVLIGWLKRSHF